MPYHEGDLFFTKEGGDLYAAIFIKMDREYYVMRYTGGCSGESHHNNISYRTLRELESVWEKW
jgi:hypothetical protein